MSRKPFSTLYEQVLFETFSASDLSDIDYFLLFSLLHEYEFREAPDVKSFGLTQREASETLAVLWSATHLKEELPDKKKNPESHYDLAPNVDPVFKRHLPNLHSQLS